jgi:hypothetical protein
MSRLCDICSLQCVMRAFAGTDASDHECGEKRGALPGGGPLGAAVFSGKGARPCDDLTDAIPIGAGFQPSPLPKLVRPRDVLQIQASPDPVLARGRIGRAIRTTSSLQVPGHLGPRDMGDPHDMSWSEPGTMVSPKPTDSHSLLPQPAHLLIMSPGACDVRIWPWKRGSI